MPNFSGSFSAALVILTLLMLIPFIAHVNNEIVYGKHDTASTSQIITEGAELAIGEKLPFPCSVDLENGKFSFGRAELLIIILTLLFAWLVF
ncbi:hypothetical protein [Methanosarcina siciliae]|uniref:hypothetical protein n=1 Tax=Methanosarcina siciliae TaxID=38027 RepID=UPI000AEB01DD|nr:hypothetical protein [Methanosarcina siciliae]